MNYQRYFYGGGWVICLLLSKMVLAQPLVINLSEVKGQGIDMNNVYINNILIDTLIPNFFTGILEWRKVAYSYKFRACQNDPVEPNTLYLEPLLTDLEPPCHMSPLDFTDSQVFGGMNDINGMPYQVQLNHVRSYAQESEPIDDLLNPNYSAAANYYNIVLELNLEKLRLEQIDKYRSPLPSFPIKIVLSWEESRRLDFDAHLTGPAPSPWLQGSYFNEPGRFHIYFGNKNYESIYLSTDDFSNSQPEIIEIYPPLGHEKLRSGIYRYSVHHFQGNDDFVAAKVQVHLLIDGQEQVFEPPLFAADDNYRNSTMLLTWKVFELIVNESGMIRVQPQQHYYRSNPPEVRRKN
jgi:hypothetical protein